MPAGITRVNGVTRPESFYGYQPRYFRIAGTGFDTNPFTVESNFEKASRAIQVNATQVTLGRPAAAGFMVQLEGATYVGRGDATGSIDNSTATLAAVILAATGITAQVTEMAMSGTTFVVV